MINKHYILNKLKKISDYVHSNLKKTHSSVLQQRYADNVIDIQNNIAKFLEEYYIEKMETNNRVDYDLLKNQFTNKICL